MQVPDVPGKWSVWSAAPGPGAVFVVPADETARGYAARRNVSYLTVRVQNPRTSEKPVITLL